MPTKTPYSQHLVSRKNTPQTQPIPGSTQVANSAGGFSWEVSKWTQLDRFLILGSEGGTYYITEQKLTQENAKSVLACIAEDGSRVVNRIVEISQDGRASKNDPAIFVLALVTAHGDLDAKKLAYANLTKVCRTGTHLFTFCQYADDLRGWGRGLRNAVLRWYTDKQPDELAYQIIKYAQREGWSHRDVLRKAHPPKTSSGHDSLFRYAAQGIKGLGVRDVPRERNSVMDTKHYSSVSRGLPGIVREFEELKKNPTKEAVIAAIQKFNLPHEAVPTDLKTQPEIWAAMLDRGMPLTALIRNLANMTRIGVFAPLSGSVTKAVDSIVNEALLKKQRVHPVILLNALKTYSAGKSGKTDKTWTPVQAIVDALDEAFYLAFKAVEPTGKSFLLALDVSASMQGSHYHGNVFGNCAGMENISPRVGSAAMALVTAAVEREHYFVGFSHNLVPIAISPKMRLDAAIAEIEKIPMGRTNCTLPITWAMQNKIKVDLFAVYTDNETYEGTPHAAQELKNYRDRVNPNARMVVISMTGNKFSIADPNDRGMLDVVGFDTNAPELISNFAAGKV